METELGVDEQHALDRRFYERRPATAAPTFGMIGIPGGPRSHAGQHVGCGRPCKDMADNAYHHTLYGS